MSPINVRSGHQFLKLPLIGREVSHCNAAGGSLRQSFYIKLIRRRAAPRGDMADARDPLPVYQPHGQHNVLKLFVKEIIA